MPAAVVAVAGFCPNWWLAATRLLIRWVRLDVAGGEVSADPRGRRRRTCAPTSARCPCLNWPSCRSPARSTVTRVTNLDVTGGDRAAAVEHW